MSDGDSSLYPCQYRYAWHEIRLKISSLFSLSLSVKCDVQGPYRSNVMREIPRRHDNSKFSATRVNTSTGLSVIYRATEPRATTPAFYCSRYSLEMAKIVPPINFGLVEDGKLIGPKQSQADKSGFYRSAQPTELNFSFLEKLKLRSLIWVGAEEPSEMLSALFSTPWNELMG